MKAKAAIVLWSDLSVKSHWVMEEAELARSRDIILPARLDGVALPFGFRNINAEDLSGWNGSQDHPAISRLLEGIERKAGPQPKPEPVSKTAIDDAVSAYHDEATFWASIAQSSTQHIEEYETYLSKFGQDAPVRRFGASKD